MPGSPSIVQLVCVSRRAHVVERELLHHRVCGQSPRDTCLAENGPLSYDNAVVAICTWYIARTPIPTPLNFATKRQRSRDNRFKPWAEFQAAFLETNSTVVLVRLRP
jgi:hypothetical protein